MKKVNVKTIKKIIIEDEDNHISDKVIKAGIILHDCEKVTQDDRDWLFSIPDDYKPSTHYKIQIKGVDLYLSEAEVKEI